MHHYAQIVTVHMCSTTTHQSTPQLSQAAATVNLQSANHSVVVTKHEGRAASIVVWEFPCGARRGHQRSQTSTEISGILRSAGLANFQPHFRKSMPGPRLVASDELTPEPKPKRQAHPPRATVWPPKNGWVGGFFALGPSDSGSRHHNVLQGFRHACSCERWIEN